MKNDLISIIIIVYNTSKYITECLNSIINQTYRNIEIIIVNDGSTDDSSKIIKKYVAKDKRIIFIDRKENKGTIYTRKEGFDNSNGKYVTFVDSDDMLELNAIEIMYNEIVNNKCDIVKSNFKTYKNGKKVKDQVLKRKLYKKEKFEPKFYDLLFSTIHLNTMCGMLISKKCLKDINKVDLSLIYGEDLSSNLYMYKNTNSLLVIDDCLYIYRQNENSITYTYRKEKLIKKIEDSIKTYLLQYRFIDIYNIQGKDKYKNETVFKLRKYITLFSINFCYNEKYKEFESMITNTFNNKELDILFVKNISKFQKNNIMIRVASKMLFKKHYYLFYIYSKFIYKNFQKLYYRLKR